MGWRGIDLLREQLLKGILVLIANVICRTVDLNYCHLHILGEKPCADDLVCDGVPFHHTLPYHIVHY